MVRDGADSGPAGLHDLPAAAGLGREGVARVGVGGPGGRGQ